MKKKVIKIIFIVLFSVIIPFLIGYGYEYFKYPPINILPRSNGIIHHPTYGDYPEEVPFEQGMTLMPGQSAEMEIGISFQEDKPRINWTW